MIKKKATRKRAKKVAAPAPPPELVPSEPEPAPLTLQQLLDKLIDDFEYTTQDIQRRIDDLHHTLGIQ